jgi:hypothetical protein
MGRNTLYASNDEKIEAIQKYQKKYYANHKVTKLNTKVINNAIERIKRDDRFIQMFIESVGRDKIHELIKNE